jgi:drug/metabolite transporter (DMT)-like permease
MFTTMSRRQTGVMLAIATAVISGFAVFINGYGVRAWVAEGVASPTTYTTFKNVIAAAALLGFGLVATRRQSTNGLTRPTSRRQWVGLGAVAVVGGSLAFALFFEGLARASSVQAAFLHKTLLVWVGILAVGFLHEKIRPMHIVAVVVLVWGQIVLVGGLSEFSFGLGEMMIFAATLLWSVEIIIAKRMLFTLSSTTVGVARMAGGAALLVFWGWLGGGFGAIGAVGFTQIGWVLVTGVVLASYVGTWYAALARAPALDVTSVLVGGAVITAVLRYVISGTPLPSMEGLVLVGIGFVLAVVAGFTRPEPEAVPAK